MYAADKPEPDACAALKNENSSLAVAHHRKKNPINSDYSLGK